MPSTLNDRVYLTWGEARTEADKIGGHVRCLHYAERYEYAVYPGKDPRAMPEPQLKKVPKIS